MSELTQPASNQTLGGAIVERFCLVASAAARSVLLLQLVAGPGAAVRSRPLPDDDMAGGSCRQKPRMPCSAVCIQREAALARIPAQDLCRSRLVHRRGDPFTAVGAVGWARPEGRAGSSGAGRRRRPVDVSCETATRRRVLRRDLSRVGKLTPAILTQPGQANCSMAGLRSC